MNFVVAVLLFGVDMNKQYNTTSLTASVAFSCGAHLKRLDFHFIFLKMEMLIL
jgi:hypothetical protein